MAIGRRTFLAGGAAAVAAAATAEALDAFDRPQWQRGLHRLGLASSPDRTFPPSGAVERSGTLRSRHLRRRVGWTVSLPAGGPPEGVVFCLHGYHGDHRMAFDAVAVPDAAAAAGLRVAVAAVDGGADSYWHRRADGTDAQAMLLEEFVPLVRGMVGHRPSALMGWSMGGYGALLAAERAPRSFVGVAPASPALWRSPDQTAPGAFDGPGDFWAHDVYRHVAALGGLQVAVACGTGDPFYAATRALVAEMTFPHLAVWGAGYHDVAYWRSVAPTQLRALAPALVPAA